MVNPIPAPVDMSVSQTEFNSVAQLSHFGWGLGLVALAKAMSPVGSSIFLAVAALWILYSYVKEFVYDDAYETVAVRGSSKEDFWVAVAGSVVGIGLILLSRLWL